jgi:isopenicillin N synthase-like dioxygenase
VAGVPDEIPVVDLADYLSGVDGRRRRAAELVDDSCSATGFFMLRGHEVDPAVITGIRAASTAFFGRPELEKLRYHYADTSRGYLPIGRESLAPTLAGGAAPPDVKQAFAVGAMDLPEAAGAEDGLRRIDWPDRPAGFRRAWLDCYRVMRTVAGSVMELFADALGVSPATFAARMTRSMDFLRVIDYPAQASPPAAGAMRAGAHTDFGALTLLAIDDAPGGLEIRLRGGGWRAVPTVPGTLVVNIGDLMAYWTGGRWVSSLHRVVNPPVGRRDSSRQTLAFFHNPEVDAAIEPLPECVRAGGTAGPAIVAGEWLRSKTLRQRLGARTGG